MSFPIISGVGNTGIHNHLFLIANRNGINDEANPQSPVSIANRIVSAITLGGCYDHALLGALRDSWYNGHARWFSGKAMGSGE